ncbi:metal-dependent transcriptional regulator [Eubacterium xylanophilum]|uniref:metal-dependent transcriptional regulator n=1 Tax=Eubacterium xylanophilum TaxID=39497 RepID=UPI00047E68C4|nr:metal-dependent transcriptional regulator [Eubacterium xylanophilum]
MGRNESSEDYLEAILQLSDKLPVVRSVDIAECMGYKKSSVSVAMKKLRESECINTDKSGFITLTEKGREIALRIYERHRFMTDWLISLGVEKDVAEEDACMMEHDMSIETFNAIKKYVLEKGDLQ